MADQNQSELSERYNPSEVEKKNYTWWEENGYFKAEDESKKPPFCIILPPPNVTGSLHLGHALDHTIQDTLVRWKRMSGFNTLWMPGTDHAGIATQSVVERELAKEGGSRQDLGRDKFVEKVWEWKHKYGNRICEQMRLLGDSVDWDRLTFTLDDNVSKAVRKVFVDLYKKGWIYRGTRLINWSPKLESALSDLEVEHKDIKGSLWHLKYPIEGINNKFIIVATTRPETMLGDTAVAVHPQDERYKDLIGKNIKLPLSGRLIPIIADEYVDKEFGSGAVKITPAHDFNDYEMGVRHNLEMINILNTNGTLNEVTGKYKGLNTAQARKQIVEDLEVQGFMQKIEPHQNSVGHCSKTGCVVEPFLSDQWFVKTEELAIPAKRVVESGTTEFLPESWTKTYLHWMNNIQDWCISRQLWWGHRIPAWYCEDCNHTTVSESVVKECEKCESESLRQDEDVLDTWFSSGLWPFSTLGWPKETAALKTFYPTDVLVTGHDIIFFWVARMIMSGLEFKKDVPFRSVYIHGLIRDAQGRKMSKSLNNSIDPVEIIEEVGADALRFTLMAQINAGRDLKFSQQRLEGYRNFMNKIWNAARFALSNLKDFEVPPEGTKAVPVAEDLSDADKWILAKLGQCEKDVNEHLSQYRFSDAASSLYSFAWLEFCDWYLEFIKPIVYGEIGPKKKATQLVLAQVLNRLVRLLHPFTPFITEEIYQKLPIKGKALIIDKYPTPKLDKELLSLGNKKSAHEMDVVREVISAVRNIRGENRIKPGEKIKAHVIPNNSEVEAILTKNQTYIETLARISDLGIGETSNLSKCALTPIRLGDSQVDVVVYLEGLVDFNEEITRLKKNIEKVNKEKSSLEKRLSNDNFVKNAPAEVVEQGKLQLQEHSETLASLQLSLDRLS